MLPVMLLLAAAAAPLPEVQTHDGGVCLGPSWVRLLPGEKAFIEDGPDFSVFRFEGPNGAEDHWWGVYVGGYAQVHGNGPLLINRDGWVVHRAIEDGKFRGYLAEKGRAQNHFFGSVFNGTSDDEAFFRRIDFGSVGQALCAKGYPTTK